MLSFPLLVTVWHAMPVSNISSDHFIINFALDHLSLFDYLFLFFFLFSVPFPSLLRLLDISLSGDTHTNP